MNSFSEKKKKKSRVGLITEEGKNICPPNKIVQNVFDIQTLLQMSMNTVLKLCFKTIIIKYNAYF